jgi:hypothetical protein
MSRQVTLTLPAAGQAPWVAREVTREMLAAWRVSHLEETAVLLISELVTNAVRHARPGRLAMALYTPTRMSHGNARPERSTSPVSGCCSSRPWPGSGASGRR